VHALDLAPRFARLLCPVQTLDGALEMGWLDQALAGQGMAVLWCGADALATPLSYQQHQRLDEVGAAFAAHGWPVRMRRSGGGVVPQGPGILNLTLAYPCAGTPGTQAQAVYRHLCATLACALGALGIATDTRAVQGSFCDGRFNLAVTQGGDVRKIAGTAQYWRRAGGVQAVLAHALLLLDADPYQLCELCSRFEAELGSARRYDPNALTSVARCWQHAHPGAAVPPDLGQQFTRHVALALGQLPIEPFPH
jgi:hypothetical protein